MNSASTSTATLVPSASKKDYQKAFGKLSSSMGFGRSMPPVPATFGSPSNTSPRKPSQSNPAAQQSQAAYWASQSHKNFEAALGGLSGSYGFAGNAPSSKSKSS